MTEHPECWTVTLLGLAVNFSSPDQLLLIPSLLKCFPSLRGLRIFVRFLMQYIISLKYLCFAANIMVFLVFRGLIHMRPMMVLLLTGRECSQASHASKQQLIRLGFMLAVVMTSRLS